MNDHPPPSPEKLLRHFREWLVDAELPGRTMSNLKTGFLPDLFEQIEQSPSLEAMTSAWDEWEAGITNPTAVLESLRDNGLDDLLSELAKGSPGP